MKKLVAALALLTLPCTASAFVCAAPRCVDVEIQEQPGLNVPDRRVRVFLPAGYDADGTKDYPVLYLLHGAGDTYKTWSQNTDLFDLVSGLPLIVVMPDGGANAQAGWYSDWADGSRQWETFHIEVLIPYVDATYRTLGDGHRAIAGLSMGGYGAMKYAARHPGLFAAAASFSGAVDIMFGHPANSLVFELAGPYTGTPSQNVWGNQVTNEANWRANNPADLAADLAGTRILLTTGNGLPGGAHDEPANASATAVEAGVWQLTLSFRRALDAAGVPHTDFFYGSGQHTWPYWRDALSWALPQILASISE